MGKGKVAVAMSGGVDSSVAAVLLMEAGYAVVGVTMRLSGEYDAHRPPGQRGCCSLEDVEDARRVCQVLGAPHYLLNFEREFQAHVIGYFIAEYQRGRTPNPCLACNDRIKFNFLLRKARALGIDYIATGHYARLDRVDGRWRLRKAVTPAKDQSYVLFSLRQEEMEHLLLPVGWYPKEEVRRIAARWGLPVADKPDSQEVCFIPQGDYRQFLRERVRPTPGEIVDTSGRGLGRHPGIEFFTVGQRRGLGLTAATKGGNGKAEPLYVVEVDAAKSRVVVGRREELLRETLWASQVSYVAGEAPGGPVEITARIRYKGGEAPATLVPLPGEVARLDFRRPQPAVTPGQAVVFYQGEEVLGGGTIETEPPLAGGAPSPAEAVKGLA